MLSREVMGLALLGVLWVTALLLAASAWQDVRDLLRRRRALRLLGPGESGEGMIEGEIAEGAGDGGAMAKLVVEQVGRAQDEAARAIAFSDRSYVSSIAGGELAAEGRTLQVAALEGEGAELWASDEERARAASCPDGAAFDRAWPDAKKARGHVRQVVLGAAKGDKVFVAGRVEKDGDAWKIAPNAAGWLLVSKIDPRAFCAKHASRILLFVVAELAICGVITRVALWQPYFGTVSTIGAVLGLAFFLLATPVGVQLRTAARFPHRAVLRGRWTAAKSEQAATEVTQAES
jgi:hypothetical protein